LASSALAASPCARARAKYVAVPPR
jgi:hypothetical protein